jgi:hypothetical protein
MTYAVPLRFVVFFAARWCCRQIRWSAPFLPFSRECRRYRECRACTLCEASERLLQRLTSTFAVCSVVGFSSMISPPSQLPTWLSTMTNISSLSLSYNKLYGTIPAWLSRLRSLS